MGMKVLWMVLAAGLLSLAVFLGLQKWEIYRRQTPRPLPEGISLPYPRKREPLDYNTYIMKGREKLFYVVLAAVLIFGAAYIFYRSIWLSLLLTPLSLYYPKIKIRELIARRKNELTLQFKEALYCLASSLSAGKSVELAFKDVLQDMALLYPDPHTYILQEIEEIVRKIEMNETVEEALTDFAKRSHLEDVVNFADIFVTAKRSGGNMVEIIRNTSVIIGDKLRIKEEINTLLAARKFEQKVLHWMPVVLLLLLSWSVGDYMKPVFETVQGHIVMTVALILLGAASFISKKVMKIEV